jgi:hypothetical protein
MLIMCEVATAARFANTAVDGNAEETSFAYLIYIYLCRHDGISRSDDSGYMLTLTLSLGSLSA